MVKDPIIIQGQMYAVIGSINTGQATDSLGNMVFGGGVVYRPHTVTVGLWVIGIDQSGHVEFRFRCLAISDVLVSILTEGMQRHQCT